MYLSIYISQSICLSLYTTIIGVIQVIHVPFVPRKATQVASERRNAKPDQFCRIFSLDGKWSSLCLWQECLIFEAKQFHEPLKCLRAPRSLGLRISGAGLWGVQASGWWHGPFMFLLWLRWIPGVCTKQREARSASRVNSPTNSPRGSRKKLDNEGMDRSMNSSDGVTRHRNGTVAVRQCRWGNTRTWLEAAVAVAGM